jgi:toxin ParE1/3/4
MVYKLIVSKEAHIDIDNIVTYIAVELANSSAAIDFLDDVERSYRAITNNPRMYSLCDDSILKKDGYRKIVIRNYLVFYRIDEEKKIIIIVRVIYGGRNYNKLL